MAEEKNFENRIKSFLKDSGAWFIKYWAGAQFTKSGIPDILSCINGQFVAIEVKATRGRPKDIQVWNLHQIEKAGGWSWLLYPKDFGVFKEFVGYVKTGQFYLADELYREFKGWCFDENKVQS